MAKTKEVQGREFDWYAIDQEGNYALFATAGEGFIPDQALALASTFDALSDSIETPNWGSASVWDDYAKSGLYVFDWKLQSGGPYVRARRPTARSSELINRLASTDEIPKFDGAFERTPSIGEWPTS